MIKDEYQCKCNTIFSYKKYGKKGVNAFGEVSYKGKCPICKTKFHIQIEKFSPKEYN